MNKSELELKIAKIEERINALDLPNSCITVIRNHGKYSSILRKDHSQVDGSYADDFVQMTYSGDRSKDLIVRSEGNKVFHCSDGWIHDIDSVTGIRFPTVSHGYRVHSFVEGAWLPHLLELKDKPRTTYHFKKSGTGPEPEIELSQGALFDFKRRFPDFFYK